jgi:D-alanine-D-alanine ligase-like ATP-grasp enzyme
VSDPDDLISISERFNVKLYTRNVPKTKEFRVHVMGGEVIHVAQKRAMSDEKLSTLGINESDRSIRSYERGWVFANELDVTEKGLRTVKEVAVEAVNGIGLHFGAVDVLATGAGRSVKRAVVCEINTAPSLSGDTTLSSYVKGIQEIANEN